MISYNPLWKTLIDHNKKKLDLLEIADISRGTLAKMGKNESVNLIVIDKICQHFQCRVEDVIEFVPGSDRQMEYMELKIMSYQKRT